MSADRPITQTLRRDPRVRASQVRIKVRYPGADRLWELYLKDISKGGLFIRTEVVKPVRTVLEVWLDLDRGEPLRLEAEVVHAVSPEEAGPGNPSGMGVQFKDPSEAGRLVLEALVDKLGRGELSSAGAMPEAATLQLDGADRRLAAAQLFEQAEHALASGDFDEALNYYRLAAATDPTNPRFQQRLAQMEGKGR